MLRQLAVLAAVAAVLAGCVGPAPTSKPPGASYPGAGSTLPPVVGYPGPGEPPANPPYPAVTASPAPPGAAAPAIPAVCRPSEQGRTAYFSLSGGYCLQAPGAFRVGDVRPGSATLFGPPLDQSPDPVRATLEITFEPLDGRTLGQASDQVVSGAPGLPITRTPAILGGEPAELLEGVPGRTLSRQLLAIHGDRLYRLVAFPADPLFPQAAPDVEAAWQVATAAFAFLPSTFVQAYASCPAGSDGASAYLNPFDGYCLLFPPNMKVEADPASATLALYGPPHEPGPEPVMVSFSIVAADAGGRTAEQAADEFLAAYPAEVKAAVTRSSTTIGGQPAALLDGAPARLRARMAFVVHEGRLYHFAITPYGDPAFAAFQAEADAAWQQAAQSFVFVARP